MDQARRRSAKVRNCIGAVTRGEEGEEDEPACRCAMKPPTPRLAAVEVAEQAQKLRVVGGGELIGVGKEAAGEGRIEGWPMPKRENRRWWRWPDRWRR
jgi:hypothetical protein